MYCLSSLQLYNCLDLSDAVKALSNLWYDVNAALGFNGVIGTDGIFKTKQLEHIDWLLRRLTYERWRKWEGGV